MNAEFQQLRQEIIRELKAAQSVLLMCHIRPDGDAIGSILGLGLSLQALHKRVCMVSPDGVPSNLAFLTGSQEIHKEPYGDFECICVLDSADLQRINTVLAYYTHVDINIDHHVTNERFARLNLVDDQAASTAEMLTELLLEGGFPITQSVSEALLTGIITDTIGFRTANVSPRTLRLAALLMEHGAPLSKLYQLGLVRRTFDEALLWGAGLVKLQRQDRLLWTVITLEDRQKAGYNGKDDADLVNMLTTIEGADVVIVFLEQPKGKVKVSWRARPGFDVAALARRFGGGGHAAAAGAELSGSLEEVQKQVIEAIQPVLQGKS